MKQLMPQQCPMAFIYMTWAVYVAGLVYLPLRGDYGLALAWAAALPTVLWSYVRAFPRISQYLGYGRVEDVSASQLERSSAKVTMYGSAACPFCPIVRRRLDALREEMGFDLEYVDVTAKPGILTSKRIKAVPVVEVGGRQIVGHATSEQLSELVLQG
jgi:glutaredoxin